MVNFFFIPAKKGPCKTYIVQNTSNNTKIHFRTNQFSIYLFFLFRKSIFPIVSIKKNAFYVELYGIAYIFEAECWHPEFQWLLATTWKPRETETIQFSV